MRSCSARRHLGWPGYESQVRISEALIRSGKRSEDWAEFAGTAEENPKIDRAEFAVLVREYPEGSIALQEEIYASLLQPGAGLAFPEWRDGSHVIDGFEVPKHWHWGAGFDWGYHDPSVFVLCAVGEESHVVVMRERKWTQTDGMQIGSDIADLCIEARVRPDWIASDSSIWGVPAKKGYGNMAEDVSLGIIGRWRQRGMTDPPPVLAAVPKGPESRITRAGLLHRYLRVPVAKDGQALAPRLLFLRSCTYCVSSIPKLPPDPRKPEDVDTTSDDHAYDALTYFLLSRGPIVEAPSVAPAFNENRHPGFEPHEVDGMTPLGDPATVRTRKPWENQQPEDPGPPWRQGERLEPLGW